MKRIYVKPCLKVVDLRPEEQIGLKCPQPIHWVSNESSHNPKAGCFTNQSAS